MKESQDINSQFKRAQERANALQDFNTSINVLMRAHRQVSKTFYEIFSNSDSEPKDDLKTWAPMLHYTHDWDRLKRAVNGLSASYSRQIANQNKKSRKKASTKDEQSSRPPTWEQQLTNELQLVKEKIEAVPNAIFDAKKAAEQLDLFLGSMEADMLATTLCKLSHAHTHALAASNEFHKLMEHWNTNQKQAEAEHDQRPEHHQNIHDHEQDDDRER